MSKKNNIKEEGKSLKPSFYNKGYVQGDNSSVLCNSQVGDTMELLEEIKSAITKLGRCKAAGTLAHAAASACSQNYGVSLLRICVGLDYSNKNLILQLFDIANYVDFSNRAQDEMLFWLENNGWLLSTPTAEQF